MTHTHCRHCLFMKSSITMTSTPVVKNNRFNEDRRVDLTPEDLADPSRLCVKEEDMEEVYAELRAEWYDLCEPVEAWPGLHPPLHPWEVLRDALANNHIKHKDFADAIGILPPDLSNIINWRRCVSPNMASRIAKALGTSIEMWLNIQSAWDAYQEKTDPKRIEAVSHVREVVLA